MGTRFGRHVRVARDGEIGLQSINLICITTQIDIFFKITFTELESQRRF